jgi:ribulose-5-phosphate 4-epimerase/fuculose-1-phosphate aldolase
MNTFNQQQRIDLAAAYRLIAEFGWDDLTSTHISARMESPDHFLINSRDQLFSEITASSLIEVNEEGELLTPNDEAALNQAGFVIHGAVHKARPEVGCVLHTHTIAGMAVSAMEEGLLPLNQTALRFYNNIGYHTFEGIALDMEERERLVADLGDNEAMVLQNHGLLTVGRTVAEAFSVMFYLEKACQAQIQTMSASRNLLLPSEQVCEHTRQQYVGFESYMEHDWQALKRKLDLEQPDYRK